MAKIDTSGIDELCKQMDRLGASVDAARDEMLTEAGKIGVEKWKAAIQRAGLENARVVFGSATPSVESIFACRIGRYALFRLESRFGAAELPETDIVDLREELRGREGEVRLLRETERRVESRQGDCRRTDQDQL